MQASAHERLIGGLGTALVLALLGYLLLIGMIVQTKQSAAPPITLLRLDAPRRQPPLRPRARRPHATRASAPSSPPNLRSKATDIIAPPRVVLAPPPPLVAAPIAGVGAAASAGASTLPGPGAGGQGMGAGGGGDGDGDGAGDTPPRQIRGRLKSSDLPTDLRDGGIGGIVSVRYHVEVDGSVDHCTISASSGNAELDEVTCTLIEQRFRFKPSRDRDGRPVGSVIVQRHIWEVDPTDPPRP